MEVPEEPRRDQDVVDRDEAVHETSKTLTWRRPRLKRLLAPRLYCAVIRAGIWHRGRGEDKRLTKALLSLMHVTQVYM